MSSLTCPKDSEALVWHRVREGHYHSCPKCHGKFVGLYLLKRMISGEGFKTLWTNFQEFRNSAFPCPKGHKNMRQVFHRDSHPHIEVDFCPQCYGVWFDAQELEELKGKAQLPYDLEDLKRGHLHPNYKALEESVRPRAAPEPFTAEAPDPLSLQWFTALLGLPTEERSPFLLKTPYTTWALMLFIFLFSYVGFQIGEAFLLKYAFISNDPFRMGGLTLFSSAFLHANWPHLLGNLFFLMVFGDDVENYLGRKRFLWLFLLAALGGNLLYFYGVNPSETPAIGASGGVYGIMAFYILQFPKSNFYYLFFFRYWFRIPAVLMFGGKILLEMFAIQSQGSGSGVNHFAHVGGAAIGLAAFLIAPSPQADQSKS